MAPGDTLDQAGLPHQPEPLPPKKKKPKRFRCPRCQTLFGRLEHLRRHERSHTQERPFSCNQCASRFTRSDLLIRHGRLSHSKDTDNQIRPTTAGLPAETPSLNSRGAIGQPVTSCAGNEGDNSQHHTAKPTLPASVPEVHGIPANSQFHIGQMSAYGAHSSHLPTFSLNAEHQALQDAMATSSMLMYGGPTDRGASAEDFINGVNQYSSMGMDESMDSFAEFFENEPLSSYHFTSLVTTEQPVPFFAFESPQSSSEVGGNPPGPSCVHEQRKLEDPNFPSRFGSRLPSPQPDENLPGHNAADLPGCEPHETHRQPTRPKRIFDISSEDRKRMLLMMSEFVTVLPRFQFPTTLSMSRYIRSYISGFHEHLPFLHLPTMSVEACSIELLLAMAAVGTQYCFEAEKGIVLFHAARAIATERIRRRDAACALAQRDQESVNSPRSARSSIGSATGYMIDGPPGLPSDPGVTVASVAPKGNLMQSAQALLILMAMATWTRHQEISRESLAIQSVLASIIRDEGLHTQLPDRASRSWEEWVQHESVLRTKYVVFCFFNLHCIVYDTAPLILNSELKMRLPCSAAEFKADTEAKWEVARNRHDEPSQFQEALHDLFSRRGRDMTKWHSSLGNYVLIHAIIQHIFFIRQTASCRFSSSELTVEDVAPLERALRNWQLSWTCNPESSLDPLDPSGPVAFNSTALLRLAHIRLNMNTGPGRALKTRDPLQVANALRATPILKRTPRLIHALLHAAQALNIPVKVGMRLVARTQMFIWSIQHSLCSLECALLLSKWLEAVSVAGPNTDPPISEDEKRILSLVKTMVNESDFVMPTERLSDAETAKFLNLGVLRMWASIFKGAQTWAIVEVIGSALDLYADMLEGT